MNARILQIIGGMVLLACMVFALFNLESADQWISAWIPFVIAGVGLAFAGGLLGLKELRTALHGRAHSGSSGEPSR